MTQPSDPSFPKNLQWALGVYFLCFLAVYGLLQLKYRVAEVDDTWEVSRAYNFLHHGITYDAIDGSSDISSGIQYFRKGYTFLMGVVLDRAGYTKPNSYFLSLAFLLAGFACWYPTLRRLDYGRGLSAAFCVTGLLLDPFFSAALCAREEAFIFFISSLALLFFVRESYLPAMLLGWISLETHPTGAFAFFLMAAAYFAARPQGGPHPLLTGRNPWVALAGLVLGALFYVWLHAPILNPDFPSKLLQANRMGDHSAQNFLFDYFFHSKYNRHLLDLGLLVLCLIEFFRRRIHTRDRFILPLAVSLSLFCLIFQRPQYHYVLYFYPVFLLVLAKVVEDRWKPVHLVWGLLAFLLPQYAAAYYVNRAYDYRYEIAQYQKWIPPDNLPVLGTPNAWFAFPGRDFYLNRYDGDFSKLGLERFYLVSDEGFRDKPDDTTRAIERGFKAKPIADFSMGHWRLSISLEEASKPVKP